MSDTSANSNNLPQNLDLQKFESFAPGGLNPQGMPQFYQKNSESSSGGEGSNPKPHLTKLG